MVCTPSPLIKCISLLVVPAPHRAHGDGETEQLQHKAPFPVTPEGREATVRGLFPEGNGPVIGLNLQCMR